jgi:hypothetical protein
MNWIHLGQGPLEGPCDDGNKPSCSIKCREILGSKLGHFCMGVCEEGTLARKAKNLHC